MENLREGGLFPIAPPLASNEAVDEDFAGLDVDFARGCERIAFIQSVEPSCGDFRSVEGDGVFGALDLVIHFVPPV